MNEQSPAGRLGASQKSALLGAMRAAPTVRPAAAAPVAVSAYDTSFRSLPGYRQLEMQRAFASVLGLANPFNRLHDVRAGARSQIEGREVINFASYDYLGLNGHAEIEAAVGLATRAWGTSVSASRITAGERPFHRSLEQALAEVYQADDALAFVSGHAAAISTISALMGPRDLVVLDQLSHNCLTLGAQLSGAARRTFAHNDLDSLEATLAEARDKFDRALIVTEGLFSMDGDGPDVARLVKIKQRWGCWLMMDEAHALGVMGATGLGSFENGGVDPREVDIWYGTMSKSLVSCGGYVAGSQPLIDFLRLTAPGMVYSVGLPPQASEAARMALLLMRREPERVARLQENARYFSALASDAGLDIGSSKGFAVVPVIVGDSLRTVTLADRLLQRGVNAFPIIPPGVPEKSARLRFFLSSEHQREDLRRTVAILADLMADVEREGVSIAAAAHRFSKQDGAV